MQKYSVTGVLTKFGPGIKPGGCNVYLCSDVDEIVERCNSHVDTLETVIETQRQRITELEQALRIIAGEAQCPDGLMGDADVARAALYSVPSK